MADAPPSVAELVDRAFDYRGDVTVERTDGTAVTGYVFNRDARAPVPFLQIFDQAGDGPFEVPYSEIRTIRLSGRDTAAGTSWKAWVRRHEAEKGARTAATGILILTGLELEARWFARALLLPPLHGPFPSFGDGAVRLAPVGLGARRMADRLEPLAAGLSSPLVVSAGLCGSLDPGLPVGALVIPEVVLDTRGARSPTVDLPGCRREGTLVTVAEVLSTPEAKNGLRAATGALATDMESSTIVAAAATRGWPALVVRAVSDDARTSLPPALVRLVDDDGALRVGAAALTLIARPALLPRALALRRDQRLALRAAAAALELLVRPGPGRT